MASVRSSFVQSCNFNNNPFYPGASGVICSIGIQFNNDDKDQTKIMPNLKEVLAP
jgi:hypothetical protein